MACSPGEATEGEPSLPPDLIPPVCRIRSSRSSKRLGPCETICQAVGPNCPPGPKPPTPPAAPPPNPPTTGVKPITNCTCVTAAIEPGTPSIIVRLPAPDENARDEP